MLRSILLVALVLCPTSPAWHIGAPPKPAPPGPLTPGPSHGPTTGSGGGSGKQKPPRSTAASSAGAVGGARTSGGMATRGGSGRALAAATTDNGSITDPLDTWEAWWEHNQDAFLDLKTARPAGRTVSGSPGQLTGRGRRAPPSRQHRPSRQQLDDEVVPALLDLLATHDERELLNAASLAVGRVAGPPLAAAVQERLVALLGHNEIQVQASAAIGLGALGTTPQNTPLLALLSDDSAGRILVGGGPVDTLLRSVSALSLGLSGDARSIWNLMDLVQRLPDSEREVKASAIAALGLLPADHPRTRVGRLLLLEMLDDRRLDPLVASVIPTTLGKMGAREALPRLVTLLADSDTDLLVRQSCAIGLGLLGTLDDPAVLQALLDTVTSGRDRGTRHFALIALGEIGAAGIGDPEGHDLLLDTLVREVSAQGADSEHRSWASLAAAIYGRGVPAAVPPLVTALREAHRSEHDPSFRGAFALALALLGDEQSLPAILADLEVPDESLSGHSAVAAGLLGDLSSTSSVRALLHRKGAGPGLRIRAATSLALLGDTDSVPTLITLLQDGSTYDEQAAFSRALGLIGDSRAVPVLVALALDERAKLRDRGFACVALGLLGERTRLPFHAGLKSDTNYLARIEPLVQVAQIL